jgi:hypothetical protein
MPEMKATKPPISSSSSSIHQPPSSYELQVAPFCDD